MLLQAWDTPQPKLCRYFRRNDEASPMQYDTPAAQSLVCCERLSDSHVYSNFEIWSDASALFLDVNEHSIAAAGPFGDDAAEEAIVHSLLRNRHRNAYG